MPLAVQSYARGRAISAGFRIELNDVDGVARTRHVDTHAAGELVAADHGMSGIADGGSANAARGVGGGLAPGAGDLPAAIGELGAWGGPDDGAGAAVAVRAPGAGVLPAAIGELGACVELIVGSGAAHGLRDA